MKYYIKIQGGFTGIPKILEGEVLLDPEKTRKLLEALGKPGSDKAANWPDALHYTVQLVDGSRTREAEYREDELPALIRNFVDEIRLG